MDTRFSLNSFTGLAVILAFTAFSLSSSLAEPPEDNFALLRKTMVERDLVRRGIKDPRVLGAMARVERHLFVPDGLELLAYTDRPLPIGGDQTISQPYVVALMTELLNLTGEEKVLEIGTGSGYQAAILSVLAREVYTIEILPSLAEDAKARLERLGYRNVQVKTGDGFFGWEEKGPFDAILVTASADQIPAPLWKQLQEGGRLIMPLGESHKPQRLVRVTKIKGKRHEETITGVIFVPMTGEARKAVP
ncbi:MAG: protein-L-isoaspartate(D-aspartate) O-methyltransferase [Deltaproteobacteria bacterium]|nr:protein-L-isoaspartate(D-aspartate) O-methyltransferase [Deltaproteobacteria bacterium]